MLLATLSREEVNSSIAAEDCSEEDAISCDELFRLADTLPSSEEDFPISKESLRICEIEALR